MATCLLTDKPLILKNIPDLSDVTSMTELLSQLGVEITLENNAGTPRNALMLETSLSTTAPYEVVRKMRASVLVLGPLVARAGEAHVSLPGGCSIGVRPIDLHLKGLEALGATITLADGYVHASAPHGLTGASFTFPVVSVTGTENLLMAATLARGQTRLVNAAREPEIGDLAHCLNAMGAKISGIGTDTLVIEGVESLKGTTHQVIADRIEAGTFAMAAALTGGKLRLTGARLEHIPTVASLLQQAGVGLRTGSGFTHGHSPFLSSSRCGCDDGAFPWLCNRSASPVDGFNEFGRGSLHDYRNDLGKSIYACAGALPHGSKYYSPWGFCPCTWNENT